ncbi:hypothetical protein ACLOJK_022912 [Asimina triloba]
MERKNTILTLPYMHRTFIHPIKGEEGKKLEASKHRRIEGIKGRSREEDDKLQQRLGFQRRRRIRKSAPFFEGASSFLTSSLPPGEEGTNAALTRCAEGSHQLRKSSLEGNQRRIMPRRYIRANRCKASCPTTSAEIGSGKISSHGRGHLNYHSLTRAKQK